MRRLQIPRKRFTLRDMPCGRDDGHQEEGLSALPFLLIGEGEFENHATI